MPETKDGDGKDDISISPSLMTARCRIRWAKTISTSAKKVVFMCLNKKIDPVTLEWSDPAECFYSEEINIPCGTYKGSLVVDCQNYPLEDISIKHYTFEVDLYTKDDIIEDEVDKSGLTKAEEFLQRELKSRDIDTYQDINTELTGHKMESRNSENSGIGIHISSKYQELVRQQMSQSKNLDSLDTEMEMDHSVKSDHSEHSSGRHTPLGEDGMEQFVDNDDTFLKQLKEHANGYDISRNDVQHTSLVDDDVEKPDSNHSTLKDLEQFTLPLSKNGSSLTNVRRTPTHSDNVVLSRHSSAHSLHSYGLAESEVIADVISEPSRVAISHGENSRNSSAPHTPIRQDLSSDAFGLEERRALSRDGSHHSSARQTPLSEQRNPADSPSIPTRGEGSLHSSARQTPNIEQIDDVLNPSDRHSPFKFDYISPAQTQVQSVTKETITDRFRSNPEKLYTSHQEMKQMNSSLESQTDNQSGSSRPQSLTSEQELTQYYEQSSEFRRLPATGGGSLTAQSLPTMPSSRDQRSTSTQSLPLISPQQRVKVERQSMTPDNLVRVPVTGTAVKGTLLPVRTTPMSPAGSRASSRTVTPVSAVDILMESRSLENTQKISELEATIGNLRKLLAGRDQEVLEVTSQIQDLKERNRSLQQDLENAHNRLLLPSPHSKELEQKYHQMQSEKEILSAEVVKLQDELENLRKERERTFVEDSPSINSYNPNNPFVLQRKIGDLTSQIQDLQEANEAAVAELSMSEKKIKELLAENEQIRSARSIDQQDKEEENRRLQQEMARLKEQQSYSYNEVSEHRLKIELQQVREDNRTLRERNYQLHDESLQQKEEISALRKSIEKLDRKFGSQKQDSLISRNLASLEKSDKEKKLESNFLRERSSRDSHKFTDSLPQDRSPQEPSTERISDKMKYSYTSSYEPYRSRPDGGVTEKSSAGVSTFESSESKDRSLTPRRLSSDRTKHDWFDGLRSNSDKYQFMEKTRTSSGERDVKSLTVSYPDLTKTSPPLLERAREEIQHPSSSALPTKTETSYLLSSYPRTSPATSTLQRQSLEHYSNKRDKEMDRNRDEKAHDPRHTTQSYNDDADSDTATDILVNAHPLERSTWGQNVNRRGSIGSDASASSFSDIDDQLSSSSRKRSKSADERVILRRMSPAGGTQSTPGTPVKPTERSFSRSSTALTNAGFRSITPKPLQTQHNKTTSSVISGSSITAGLHPFAPRSPGDIHVNDVVKFSRQGGKLSQGTVKFIGHLPGRGDVYLGVELDKEEGKHDGTFESIRYFKCKPNKGVFVAYNKVVMAWTTY
ncbi:hypothetical protein CHS0354_033681 [Potamilus streckersoni]|uniref:CAP-Gly domain-containing protein n=1 Tax=Potamilus streckersoni TaxID=2493646 RepID=A0AAE0VN12_9BIVA|nr:hypothetical protein CHS0354_033681 [Potamilus streckersoni]